MWYFKIHWADDGLARINGAKPEMQKMTFLKNKGDYNNIKMDWRIWLPITLKMGW